MHEGNGEPPESVEGQGPTARRRARGRRSRGEGIVARRGDTPREKEAAIRRALDEGTVEFPDLVILKYWQTIRGRGRDSEERRTVGDTYYDRAFTSWKQANGGRIVVFPVGGVYLLPNGTFHYTVLNSAIQFDWSPADRALYRIDSIAEQAREWWPLVPEDAVAGDSSGAVPADDARVRDAGPPRGSAAESERVDGRRPRRRPARASRRADRHAAERQPHLDRAFALFTAVLAAADRESAQHEAASKPNILRRVYGLVTAAFLAVDPEMGPVTAWSRSAEPSATFNAKMAVLGAEIDRAEFLLAVAAQRNAQSIYAQGMLYGTVAVGAVSACLGAALMLTDVSAIYGIAVPAGGIGALVSVFQRMTSGDLKLDFHAGKQMLRLFGGLRPAMGAIFGIALFVIFKGGLLPALGSPEVPLAFYAALGFLAGFNERFAQDMLVGSARRLTGEAAPG